MRAQQLMFSKMASSQDPCTIYFKERKLFWSDNKYVSMKYISLNKYWRNERSFGVNDKYYNKMVSCSMYGAIFTVPLEVSLSKHFTSNDENVGRLLLLINTLAPLHY